METLSEIVCMNEVQMEEAIFTLVAKILQELQDFKSFADCSSSLENFLTALNGILSCESSHSKFSSAVQAKVKETFYTLLDCCGSERHNIPNAVCLLIASCLHMTSDFPMIFTQFINDYLKTFLLQPTISVSEDDDRSYFAVFFQMLELLFCSNSSLAFSCFPTLCSIVGGIAHEISESMAFFKLFTTTAKCILQEGKHDISDLLFQVHVKFCGQSKAVIVNLMRNDKQMEEMFHSEECALSLSVNLLGACFEPLYFDSEDNSEKTLSPAIAGIVNHPFTWITLQMGLNHNSASTRKKSCFLLRLALKIIEQNTLTLEIFEPNDANSDIHTFKSNIVDMHQNCLIFTTKGGQVLIKQFSQLLCAYEILEDNQLHVISPSIKKIEALFHNSEQSDVLIPASWMLLLYMRMFKHENRHVRRDGVASFLNVNFHLFNLETCGTFFNGFLKELMQALQDDQLYCCWSENVENYSSTIPVKLIECFQNCMRESPARCKFIRNVLHAVAELAWSPVSLLHVCHAMCKMDACSAWKAADIKKLRYILSQSVTTHNKCLKETIQKLLLYSFMKFVDSADVSPRDIIQLLWIFLQNKMVSRCSTVWNEIASWFAEVCKLNGKLERSCSSFDLVLIDWFKEYLSEANNDVVIGENGHMQNIAESIALGLFLFSDGILLQKKDTHQVILVIENMMMCIHSILDKAATRVYYPQHQVVHCLLFVNSLFGVVRMSLSNGYKDPLLQDFLLPNVGKISNALLEFIARKVPVQCQNPEVLDLYMNSLASLMTMSDADPRRNVSYLRKSCNIIIAVMSTSLVQLNKHDLPSEATDRNKKHSAILMHMKSLSWCLELISKFRIQLDQKIRVMLSDFFSSLKTVYHSFVKSIPRTEPAVTKQEYSLAWWRCVAYGAKTDVCLCPDEILSSDSLTVFAEHLHLISSDSLVVMFEVSKSLLGQVSKMSEQALQTCALFVESMWKETCNLEHSPHFRPLYKAFVEAVYQPCCILSTSPVISEVLQQVLCRITHASQQKAQLLVDVVETLWRHLPVVCAQSHPNDQNVSLEPKPSAPLAKTDPSSNILRVLLSKETFGVRVTAPVSNNHVYARFLVHCLTFVSSSKDLAAINQTIRFAKSLGAKFSPTVKVTKVEDVHLIAADLALRLSQSDQRFGELCVELLLELDKSLSEKSTRCHLNSELHLTRNKVWQNILLFLPFGKMRKNDGFMQTISEVLKQELQPSIRHLVEWVMTLCLLMETSRESWIFSALANMTCSSKRFSFMCSIVSVALLVGVSYHHISTWEVQMKYLTDLVSAVIPWCMTQHFSLRLYGHAVLLRISRIFEAKGMCKELNERYPFLKNCLQFADNAGGNVKKNWDRIKESPVLFALDPVADLSLETVLCSLPRLCRLTSPDVETLEKRFTGETWLPIRNLSDKLRKMQPAAWLPQKSSKAEVENIVDNTALLVQQKANIQKKIVTSSDTAVTKRRRSGLILVASLIDKAPNLGGLTRTCEVFGAECLVVNNKSCTDDPLFQSLSVTAHKWMPIEEVKRWHLESYLSRMKAKGYVLVGTEQTEQSLRLSEYTFPEKCVILLGNEKEGIPGPLLRLLDVCLEIPQVGVIRSLNVHVSGAVTLWEYAKQRVLSNVS